MFVIHYSDVIMGVMASQITSLTIVYSTVYSGADPRKLQSSASPAFVRGIHLWLVNSPHKGPVTRNMFPFHDFIMLILPLSSLICYIYHVAYDFALMGPFSMWFAKLWNHIDGLVQERRNCSALALELHLSCINPLKLYTPQKIFCNSECCQLMFQWCNKVHMLCFHRCTTMHHWNKRAQHSQLLNSFFECTYLCIEIYGMIIL